MPIDPQILADEVFFIVGVPRSGTTLLQVMMGMHSRIGIPPETEFFMKWRPPSEDRLWPSYIQNFTHSTPFLDQGLDPRSFQRKAEAGERTAAGVFRTWLAMQSHRLNKPRIGEKSPHHWRHVEEILIDFPKAKFIHIHRDPRDIIVSHRRLPWSHGSHLAVAREWRRTIEHHFDLTARLGEDVYTACKYEDLVQQPEGVLRHIASFLGETFEPKMLEFHRRSDQGYSAREAAWKDNTRRPLTTGSIGTFAHSLTPRQIVGIQRICGEMMGRLGYELMDIPYRPWWGIADGLDRFGDVRYRMTRSVQKRMGTLPTSH